METTPESPTARPIRPRSPRFDFREVPRHWLASSGLATHIANGANLLFPSGERFFVRSVRHYLPQLDDPTLRDERDPLERYDFYVEPPEVGA